MKFSRGDITQPMTVVGETDHTGTVVRFNPDPRCSRTRSTTTTRCTPRMRRAGVFERRPAHQHRGPARGQGAEGRHALRGRHPRVRELHKPQQDPAAPRRSSICPARARTPSARSPCSITTATTRSSSPLRNNIHTPEGGMHETRLEGRAHPRAQRLRPKDRASSRRARASPATTAARA